MKRGHLHESSLELAIEAVLRIGGQGAEDEIAHLLSEARAEGQDISWALPKYIVFRLRDGNDASEVDRMIRQAQARLWRQDISLPLQAVTEALSILVQRGEFRQAIFLWSSLNQHLPSHLEPYTPDLPVLNVLLKAYIELLDWNGVRWVVRTLYDLDLRADPDFRKELKMGIKEVERRLLLGWDVEDLMILKTALTEALDFVHEFSVERKVEQRIETEKKVIDIMRGAIVDVGGDSDSDDDFEMGMGDVMRNEMDAEEGSSEEWKISPVVDCSGEDLSVESEEPISLLEYYGKARSIALVAGS